jgi:glucose dehydrogenase
LHEAWVYRTGDYSSGSPGHRATTFEATPILANGALYFCTPYNRVIALQANTGHCYGPTSRTRGSIEPTINSIR